MTVRASKPVPWAVLVWASWAVLASAADPAWLQATAYAVPKDTTNQGSGYFSIVCGQNGKLYIGTAKYGVNAYLVEFDPATKQMRVVVDCMKEIGGDAKGFAAQSKIHTRNNVGASGKIYFGTSKAIPRRTKNAPTIPAATRWFSIRRPARRAFTRSRCRTTASSASCRMKRAASLTFQRAMMPGPSRARISWCSTSKPASIVI
jgi:hypothetical protein